MVEFMMELHHRSREDGKASVEASSYRLPYLYELVSSLRHKRN